jgi:hypothetical protein
MKTTISNLLGKSAVLAVGAVITLFPVAAMARDGGQSNGGARFSGGNSAHFSGGGARFAPDRGNARFSGRGDDHFRDRDDRGRDSDRNYRGGVYLGIGGYPYRSYGYAPGYVYSPGYAYDPGYVYGPAYTAPPAPVPEPCAPAYDSYGNPIQNPACYSGQQQYAPQQYYGSPQR